MGEWGHALARLTCEFTPNSGGRRLFVRRGGGEGAEVGAHARKRGARRPGAHPFEALGQRGVAPTLVRPQDRGAPAIPLRHPHAKTVMCRQDTSK